MKKKKGGLNRWTTFDSVILVIAIFAVLITLYPMLYVISSSFSDPKAVLAGKVVLWPVGFSMTAYEMAFQDAEFWRGFINSIFYVIAGCLLMYATTVTVAYPLTRPNLMFRKFATYYLLIPMYFSGGMIPSYLVIDRLGLYNTPWALILPGAVGIWNIILCRTFMASLSQELIDSALIDGCNQIQTLIRIVMPLAKPVMAVIMIYTIVGIWNSWFNASIYTTNKDIQPVQLFLRNMLSVVNIGLSPEKMATLPMEQQRRYREMALSANQIKFAMITLSTLPIIAVYPMFQKHFTKGVMLGSLKG